MAFIGVKIFEPQLSFGTRKLYQDHIKSEHQKGLLEYLKCIARIGYRCNQDIILMLAYALSELQIINPLKNHDSTIPYLTILHFATAFWIVGIKAFS